MDAQQQTHATQGVVVSGIFAGFGLAALVLVLDSSRLFEKPFWFLSGHQFFVGLVVVLALMVAFSGIACMMLGDLAAGYVNFSGEKDFADGFVFASFIALLVAIPLLILPFSHFASSSIALVEFVVLVYFIWKTR